MSHPPLRAELCRWEGGAEWMLATDLSLPMQVLVIEALFAERNRCRKVTVDAMRGLWERGIGSAVIDLPGTGESAVTLDRVRLEDWLGAVQAARKWIAAAATEPMGTMAIRGGALLDHVASGARRWRLSPVPGSRVVRDLRRVAALGSGELGGGVLDAGGYRVGANLLSSLVSADAAEDPQVRTVRLAGDPAAANALIDGAAPWSRAEPSANPALSLAMADDFAAWTMT